MVSSFTRGATPALLQGLPKDFAAAGVVIEAGDASVLNILNSIANAHYGLVVAVAALFMPFCSCAVL